MNHDEEFSYLVRVDSPLPPSLARPISPSLAPSALNDRLKIELEFFFFIRNKAAESKSSPSAKIKVLKISKY